MAAAAVCLSTSEIHSEETSKRVKDCVEIPVPPGDRHCLYLLHQFLRGTPFEAIAIDSVTPSEVSLLLLKDAGSKTTKG